MQDNDLTICSYSQQYRQEILNVWERAVLATHDFLTQQILMKLRSW
jgi:hypothetical protein